MSTDVEHTEDGITAFEVQVNPSFDFQSAGTRIRFEFGAPVDVAALRGPHAEMEELAKELAWRRVEQLVAEKEARAQGEVERQRRRSRPRQEPTPTPQESRPGTEGPSRAVASSAGYPTAEVEWTQTAKPNNRGTFRYRPTRNLSTDALKDMIAVAIEATGGDPSLHVIYDERIGDRGLEKGNKRYGFASVKPTEDNPAYEFMLSPYKGKMYPKESFYVNFESDGTVRVVASEVYKEAIGKSQLPEDDQEFPF